MLKQGSVLYDLWRNAPVPMTIEFYIFDLVNEKEFRNGEKPHLVQRGPFVYRYNDRNVRFFLHFLFDSFSFREKRTKEDVRFYPNGTISYRESRNFSFDRQRSSDDETFRFKTINVVYMVKSSFFFYH